MKKVSSEIYRILFSNNNFYILLLEDDYVATGYLEKVEMGVVYDFEGEEVDHPKYGIQLNIKDYSMHEYNEKDQVIKFLSSGMFFGIGEKTATEIVEVIGDNTISKILEDKSILYDVKRLNERKIEKLFAKLTLMYQSDSDFTYFVSIGFSQRIANKIVGKYGKNAKEVFSENPFRLYYEFRDISYDLITRVCKNILYDLNSMQAKAARLYQQINDQLFNSGNSYLELDLFDDKEVLDVLVASDVIVIYDNCVTTKLIFDSENLINHFVKNLVNMDVSKCDVNLESFSQANNIVLSNTQESAVNDALNNRISIINGGPGTGKTTVIKAITQQFLKHFDLYVDSNVLESQLVLLAPTGRAAKRIREQTNLAASTIHRYLAWDMHEDVFKFNEENRCKAKVIVVDEFSMVDSVLFANLIKALNDDVTLIIVGDEKQLPSVSSGSVLHDLVHSHLIKTTTLDHVYRQDSESLVGFMHQIRDGIVPIDLTSKFSNRNFLICDNNQMIDAVSQIVQSAKSKGLNEYDLIVLAPMYKGNTGIDRLNDCLQEIFNPDSEVSIMFNNRLFKVNDKILLTKNFPNEDVYNGDVGRLIKINTIGHELEFEIDFDNTIVTFKKEDIYSLTHGYAMSIHKAQGSEFNHVILPISSNYVKMLEHNIIYTGITRAKSSLLMVGEVSAFVNAVTKKSQNRKTLLELFLASDYSFIEIKEQAYEI